MAQAQRIKTDPPVIRVNMFRLFKGVLREGSFWLTAATALGMVIALATFDVRDPAWTQTASVAQLHNMGGIIGAWFADVSLYFFGYPAWVLPLGVAFAGWRLFKRGALAELDAEVVLFRVLGFAVALATACGLAALHIQVFAGTVPGEGTAGGLAGVHVSQFLVRAFGFTGGNLFMVVLLLSGLTLMTGVAWVTMVDWIGAALLKLIDGAGWLILAPLRWISDFKIPSSGKKSELVSEEIEVSTAEPPAAHPGSRSAIAAKRPAVHPGSQSMIKALMSLWPPTDLVNRLKQATEVPLAWWQKHRAGAAKAAPSPVVASAPHKAQRLPVEGVTPVPSPPPKRIEPVFHKPVKSPEPVEPKPVESTPVSPVSIVPIATSVPAWAMGETLIPSSPTPGVAAPLPLAANNQQMPVTALPPVLPPQQVPIAALSPVLPPMVIPAPSPERGAEYQARPAVPPTPARSLDSTPVLPVRAGPLENDVTPAAAAPPVAVMVRSVAAPAPVVSFALPPLELLDPPPPRPAGMAAEILESLSRRVESLLKSFGIEVRVVAVEPGPVITRFEVEPAPGVKVNQISNLSKDLARGLSVLSVRVVEVIPGKSVIGLEIPNRQREVVYLREVLESAAYSQSPSPLTLALGKDIGGHPSMANLGKMPHLLVAGTTGSGKSVAINAMLLSLLYKASPSEVRLILVDPKMLELSIYEDIPHLLTPVVTDMKEAANALRWCVAEMERRYRLMATLKVRNIAGFNRKVQDALLAGEGLVDPFWSPENAAVPGEVALLQPMPFIVVVIDELADLMMIVGKKVEELIARLAQKARAAGIHLILATQRPSVDVITGLIKANIPTRMAFQVSSRVDSRTILDQMGAEQLLGHGDMLYLPPGTGLPQRMHGAFVDDHEVNRVVDYLRQTGAPDYVDEVLAEPREDNDSAASTGDGDGAGRGESDPLYDEAVRIVTESRRASVSGVQRRLRIGYNRAARLVEEMEAAGIVGAVQPNGSREVLAPPPP